jgi:hypothetical protein
VGGAGCAIENWVYVLTSVLDFHIPQSIELSLITRSNQAKWIVETKRGLGAWNVRAVGKGQTMGQWDGQKRGSRPGMHTANIPSSFSNPALRAVVDTAFCEAGANAEAAAKREAKRTNFMVEFVVSVSAKACIGVLAIFRVQVHRHEASVGFAESCIVRHMGRSQIAPTTSASGMMTTN